MSEDKAKYFIMVPKVGAQVPKRQIVAYQQVPVIENGIQVKAAVTRIIKPSDAGLVVIDQSKGKDDFEKCMAAIGVFMKKRNKEGQPPVMVGPFDSPEKAFEEMHKVRPKSDAEKVAMATAKSEALEAENEAKDKEIAELREKIAKSNAGNQKK